MSIVRLYHSLYEIHMWTGKSIPDIIDCLRKSEIITQSQADELIAYHLEE